MPRSAPFANASLIVCLTRSGPIDSAITSPPCFSFSRSASSSALLSGRGDRKSTRLNSSHDQISYAVFCLKKKTTRQQRSLLPTTLPLRSAAHPSALHSRSVTGSRLLVKQHNHELPTTPPRSTLQQRLTCV